MHFTACLVWARARNVTHKAGAALEKTEAKLNNFLYSLSKPQSAALKMTLYILVRFSEKPPASISFSYIHPVALTCSRQFRPFLLHIIRSIMLVLYYFSS